MSKITKEQLRAVFQRPFDKETWKTILIDIFRANNVRVEPEKFTDPGQAETGWYMGNIETPDNYRIGLFFYRINSGSVAHKKVGLRNLVKSWVNPNWGEFDAAIVVFSDGIDWRLSFVCDIKGLATAPRRFTFVFGERDNFYRTPIERFTTLQNEEPIFRNIHKAFSVEKLGDEFFEEYKKHYIKFVKYISGKVYEKKKGKWQDVVYHEPQPFYAYSFNSSDKTVRDYVKKLFGRIVFMYFLQRKKWLAHDPHYMTNLFANAGALQEDFLDEVLEPLFFDVLNTRPEERSGKAKLLPGYDDMPYLNGGLFQNDAEDDKQCSFPGCYFKELFDFFDRYNFTIDENDPEDAEVGIDPEMLGRIFENLLEDNKDKGAYYTPKEIVEYMCRESIITYLQSKATSDVGKQQLRDFVVTLNGEGFSMNQRKSIKDWLKDVKICDPAIGSGAFPMGMVNLLSKLYHALHLSTEFSVIKRHIMEQNIYGVDIEKGAVDIARLRFWLAMVVEDKTEDVKQIAPLPNLQFKIMQGNSLVERYGGIDLSTLLGKSSGEFQYVYDDKEFQANLESKLHEYYNTPYHDKRDTLAENIDNLISSRLVRLNENLDKDSIKPSENNKFFMWHTWFSDVFKDGGFDIVIGNPPYGAKLDEADRTQLKSIFYTTKTIKDTQKGSMDTYTMFIELSYKLLKKGGAFAMIVPISLTSSDSLSGIHRILTLRCDDVRISSYAVRPQPVFKNAVVNTSILLFRKTGERCTSLKATKMYRKGREFKLQYLVDHLQYIDVQGYTMFGRIPKVSLPIEISILQKLKSHRPLGLFQRASGKPIYYRTTGGRYFKVVTDYSTGSTKEKPIIFDENIASALGCILSSSLSFWFYQVYSNNLDWKGAEISAFPIPSLTDRQIRQLENIYKEYQADIEAKANIRTSSEDSRYNVDSFKEYKIGRSKSIIDKIDDFIGPLYGLTVEEIEFIKNYEIEFRLSDDE